MTVCTDVLMQMYIAVSAVEESLNFA